MVAHIFVMIFKSKDKSINEPNTFRIDHLDESGRLKLLENPDESVNEDVTPINGQSSRRHD